MLIYARGVAAVSESNPGLSSRSNVGALSKGDRSIHPPRSIIHLGEVLCPAGSRKGVNDHCQAEK
jgi:hypothetical protein